MESSRVSRVINVVSILLLLASSQCFFVLSSAENRFDSSNSVLESSSWVRRMGSEGHGEGQEPSRRSLLQAADGGFDHDAISSSRFASVTVDQNGSGDFTTVQGAIDAVPESNTQRVVIRIFPGTYVEKVYIPSSKPFITFLGVGNSAPVITWNDTATTAGSTWKSASVSIDAANFIAKGITFENTAPAPPPGAVGAQAIALRIGGDMAAFYGCSFLGAQDTLCDWMGRHYFENCFIQGSIDFIFGNGQSLYERCTINSIAQTSGGVSAHYRQTNEDPSGYSFVNCNIIGTGKILLGRAWGPYSRVVYSMTSMTNIIDPRGWSDWGLPSNDQTVYYGEYNNYGDGANLTQRVSFSHELTQAEAQQFLTKAWIDGNDWLGF
ncbi:unnamed protein product [Calypogeia fissa]